MAKLSFSTTEIGLSDLGGLTYEQRTNSIGDVLHCIGRAITVFALCCAIGLHWIALQSVAWTTMIVEYSKCTSLRHAISQTFDGSRPCALCHVVNNGKASEQKRDVQAAAPKIDIICVARSLRVMPPFVPFEYAISDCSPFAIRQSPPVPPPRWLS